MMMDPTRNVPRVAAPFCADVCFHLHVRWGLGAIGAALTPHAFYGWSDSGAHTTPGAPLVPPNQHISLGVEPMSKPPANSVGPNDDMGVTRVSYHATINEPKLDHRQIILEQGMGIAYAYAIGRSGGLSIPQLLALGQGTGVFGEPELTNPVVPLTFHMWKEQLMVMHGVVGPQLAFDFSVRNLFELIYDRLRWFDQKLDGGDIQQIPNSDFATTVDPQPAAITIKDV
jgi:hypothetical protein